MKKPKIKLLSYYLPQYHPIPENDEWWEKGFTEWTQVTKAKSQFKGHKQPILPGELGFYDLRVKEVQEKQSELGLEYGIDGFIYYQYWFGNGKMLLQKPAEAMLENPNIKIPFCFCWANESWKGIIHGVKSDESLIEQEYPGIHDYEAYFEYLLPFFKDDRYIKIDGMPMFHIYKFNDIPDHNVFLETFSRLAKENGFPDIYYVATGRVLSEEVVNTEKIKAAIGIDMFLEIRRSKFRNFKEGTILHKIERLYYDFTGQSIKAHKRKRPLVVNYEELANILRIEYPHEKYVPCILPNWDNTARMEHQALIMTNATPAAFEKNLRNHVKEALNHPNNPPFLVIKSWNEWGEGNYLEPDREFGRGWLEALQKVVKEFF